MRRFLASASSAALVATLGLVGPSFTSMSQAATPTDIEVSVDGLEVWVVAHAAGTNAAGDITISISNGMFRVSVADPASGAQLWSKDSLCTPSGSKLVTSIECPARMVASAGARIDLTGLDQRGARERSFEVIGDIDTTFLGSAFEDDFIGGTGDDEIFGNGGGDYLEGGGGEDTVIGGAGPDYIDVFDDSATGVDVVDCNDAASRGTDNDPDADESNYADFDEDVDDVTDCPGVEGSDEATVQVEFRQLVSGPSFPSTNVVRLWPLDGLKHASITVSRDGNAIVIADDDGDTTLDISDVEGAEACEGDEDEAPFSEVSCTFSGSVPGSRWLAIARFRTASGPISLTVDPKSDLEANFEGSKFADTFIGGKLNDTASMGIGDDTAKGGPGVDTLWGTDGGDDLEGGPGTDTLFGGPGDDVLDGGTEADTVVGGLDFDTIQAKDGVKDSIDCGEPSARNAKEKNALESYDVGVDAPVGCNVVELPSVIEGPRIDQYDVKVGENVTARVGRWRGSAPIRYSYVFLRCAWSVDSEWAPLCDQVKAGDLDTDGLVPETGQRPSYRTTRGDQGKYIRFTVTASNTKLKNGGRTSATTVMSQPVAAPPSITIDGAAWLPKQTGSTWSFRDSNAFYDLISSSKIEPYTTLTFIPVSRKNAPGAFRKEIKHGQIIDITVNGKKVSANGKTLVEATLDEWAEIKVRHHSWFADRATCPVTDADIQSIRTYLGTGVAVSLPVMTAVLDSLKGEGGVTCPWRVEWSDQVSARPFHQVTGVRVEDDLSNPDAPSRLVLTVTKPNMTSGLSLVVGPPEADHIRQLPDHFTLHTSQQLVAFPSKPYTSIWVGLMGDQVREGAKFAKAQVFVNGKPGSSQMFGISGNDDKVPFSVTMSEVLKETGTMRIVVTTYAGEPSGLNQQVVGQVFADIDIVAPESITVPTLVTWDGRCFTKQGVRETCTSYSTWDHGPEVRKMREMLIASIPDLCRYCQDAIGTLRRASTDLDRRITMMLVNSNLRDVASSVRKGSPRARACVDWLDWGCHLGNMWEAVATAIMRPKKTSAKPKPPVRPKIYVRILTLESGKSAVAVYGEGVLNIGGLLINLDGGTLINLDGGTLINLDGGTLSAAVKAALINLDGSGLLNLDGGTLVGIDVSKLLTDQGAAIAGGFDQASQIRVAFIRGPT